MQTCIHIVSLYGHVTHARKGGGINVAIHGLPVGDPDESLRSLIWPLSSFASIYRNIT